MWLLSSLPSSPIGVITKHVFAQSYFEFAGASVSCSPTSPPPGDDGRTLSATITPWRAIKVHEKTTIRLRGKYASILSVLADEPDRFLCPIPRDTVAIFEDIREVLWFGQLSAIVISEEFAENPWCEERFFTFPSASSPTYSGAMIFPTGFGNLKRVIVISRDHSVRNGCPKWIFVHIVICTHTEETRDLLPVCCFPGVILVDREYAG